LKEVALSASKHPRRREGANFRHAGSFQCSRARLQRRPGRAHIIHEHDNCALHGAYGRRDRERVAYIAVPLCGWESGLRRGHPDSLKGGHDPQVEMPRQIAGLIETALASA
jgi:hypothetical protein